MKYIDIKTRATGIKYSNDVAAKALHFRLTKSRASHNKSFSKTQFQSQWDLCKIRPKEWNYPDPKALLPKPRGDSALATWQLFSPRAVHWSQHKSAQRELYWGFWCWYKLCLTTHIAVAMWIEVSRLQLHVNIKHTPKCRTEWVPLSSYSIS